MIGFAQSLSSRPWTQLTLKLFGAPQQELGRGGKSRSDAAAGAAPPLPFLWGSQPKLRT